MKVRGFLRDSFTYAVPTLLTRAIGLVLLPIYARYLTPAEYGVVEILTIAYVLLNLVLPLEVSQAVARLSADAPAPEQKTVYVSTALSFTGLVFLTFALVTWIAPPNVRNAMLGSVVAGEALALGSLWMMANALFYVVLNQLRWDRQPGSYAGVSVVFATVTAIVSVLLIAVFNLGIHGYLWGQLAGSLAGLVTGVARLRATTRIALVLDTAQLRQMLAFSAPLVLSSIATYLALYFDRWLLFSWRGDAELGLYAVAYRVASIVTLAVSAVQLALTPMIYAHHESPDTPHALRRIFRYFLLGAGSLVLGISAFSQEIVSLLAGRQYEHASDPTRWLCLGMVLANLYVFAPGLILARRTRSIAFLSAAAALVNILASVSLVPLLGATGAALGMMAASGVSAALYLWLGERHYRVSYEWRRCAVVLLVVPVLLLFQDLAFAWRAAVLLLSCAVMSSVLLDRGDIQWLERRAANLRSR